MNINGIKVLVTRPAHQAEHLCQLIAEKGGQPIRLPVIEIVEIDDKSALLECRNQESLDIAIFISANAVEKTLPTLQPRQVIAVGKRTAQTLKAWGITALCPPPPFNSEALLSMPQMQSVTGKKIVIFRGEGGRELLADTLRERGASVKYVQVYRRVQPPTPAWIANTQIDIIIVTSQEGLRNLFAMLDGQSWLRHTPLVVMSERIRAEAERLGVDAPVVVASEASDEGLLEGVSKINQYF